MRPLRLCAFALKAVSLVLKRNVTEGIVLLRAVHRSEFSGEIQVQFVAAHVVCSVPILKGPLISIASSYNQTGQSVTA